MPTGLSHATTHDARAAALADHIAAAASVTAALQAWCAARGIGAGPVRAVRLAPPAPLTPEAAAPLALAPGETLAARRVRLVRGARALAEAENHYVPGRLPEGAAEALERGEIPFGRLLAGYGFARRPIGRRLRPGGRFVLETRALVALEGRPVALVRELYEPALLAAPGR
jgi:chorismate-pyruvate lyase